MISTCITIFRCICLVLIWYAFLVGDIVVSILFPHTGHVAYEQSPCKSVFWVTKASFWMEDYLSQWPCRFVWMWWWAKRASSLWALAKLKARKIKFSNMFLRGSVLDPRFSCPSLLVYGGFEADQVACQKINCFLIAPSSLQACVRIRPVSEKWELESWSNQNSLVTFSLPLSAFDGKQRIHNPQPPFSPGLHFVSFISAYFIYKRDRVICI